MNNDNQNTLQEGLQEQIQKKEQEIEHYRGVLERYGRGRWYHLGQRNLEGMIQDLAVLKDRALREEGLPQSG